MKKYIFPAIAVILILIYVITILPASEPERCAICDSIPMHAPALVNLATGEVGELTVYEPHPFKVAELNPYQQGGTFSFIYVAGINGYSDTANWDEDVIVIDCSLFVPKSFALTLTIPFASISKLTSI